MAILKFGQMNRFAKQIVAIISLTLVGCLYLQHDSYNDCRRSAPLKIAREPPKCSSNLVFLKAHKCASSAIQNIFMRYGFYHRKLFVLPPVGNYLGHPEPFNRNMVPDPKRFRAEYNILTHHSRLNYDEMRRVMPADTVFLTIVRNPVALFESMFHYYKLSQLWKIHFDDFNRPGGFIPDAVKKKRYLRKIGINQMMFDMGFEPKHFDDEEKIRKYIEYLDSIFSLVMVAERMDESLILLKNLLCWDYDDVVVFKVNSRKPEFRHKVNETGRQRILKLNRADQMLYEFFSKKFDRLVNEFGRRRMVKEIAQLREKTDQYYKQCVNQTVIHEKSHIVRFITDKKHNSMCNFLTYSELTLTKYIRNVQIKRYPKSVFQPPPTSLKPTTTQ